MQLNPRAREGLARPPNRTELRAQRRVSRRCAPPNLRWSKIPPSLGLTPRSLMQPVSGFWLIVAFLVCAVSAVAAAGGQPGHLVPVQHETGESAEYRGLIYKNLLVTPAQFGRMIYEPGWYEPEWAVSIYGVGATSRREQPYRSYGITVTKSLSSIWISLPSNNEEH